MDLNNQPCFAHSHEIKKYLQTAVVNNSLNSSLVKHTRDKAAYLCFNKDYTGSKDLYLCLIETQQKVLGNNHPDLVETMEHLAIVLEEAGEKSEAMLLNYRALALKQIVV